MKVFDIIDDVGHWIFLIVALELFIFTDRIDLGFFLILIFLIINNNKDNYNNYNFLSKQIQDLKKEIKKR